MLISLLVTMAVAAQAVAPPPAVKTFEAVSIRKREGGTGGSTSRPAGGFMAPNVAVINLITMSYDLRFGQLIGGPEWIRTDRYDVMARAEGNPPMTELRPMLQAMLADRFKLVTHRETREVQGYRLVMAQPGRLGPRLTPGEACSLGAKRTNGPCRISFDGPSLVASGAAISSLIGTLESRAGGPVSDDTGLSGLYDYELRWSEFQPGVAASSDLPNLFTALQEQLGLKLEPTRVRLEVLVIDSIERPTEN